MIKSLIIKIHIVSTQEASSLLHAAENGFYNDLEARARERERSISRDGEMERRRVGVVEERERKRKEFTQYIKVFKVDCSRTKKCKRCDELTTRYYLK
jgi:hypothetical protein